MEKYVPTVEGDPDRRVRSRAWRDPAPRSGKGSRHARDLPIREGSPDTGGISQHGRYVFSIRQEQRPQVLPLLHVSLRVT